MSDAHLPKDPVSLEDLKQAIQAIPPQPDFSDDREREGEWSSYYFARGEAWRTAFEWRNKFEMVTELQTPSMAEYREGMALIREKLT